MCSTTSVTQRENGENPKRPAPLLPRRIAQGAGSCDHQPSAEFALIAAALIASYVPSRRAASVSPVEALRAE
jgi:hypothetical protein